MGDETTERLGTATIATGEAVDRSLNAGSLGRGPHVRPPAGEKGFLANNSGLLGGLAMAAFAMLGMEGGIMSWLFAAAAIFGGIAIDDKKGMLGGLFNSSPEKPREFSVGLGEVRQRSPGGPDHNKDKGRPVPPMVPAPPRDGAYEQTPTIEIPPKPANPPANPKVVIPESDITVFIINKNGQRADSDASRGMYLTQPGAMRITADRYGDSAVVSNIAVADNSGNFPRDSNGVIITTNVNTKIELPVTGNELDLTNPVVKEKFALLRTIASSPANATTSEMQNPSLANNDANNIVQVTRNPLLSFMINSNGERSDKIEPGTIKIFANNNGNVIAVAIAGKDGKFANGVNGQLAVMPVTGKITLPVNNGYINLSSDLSKALIQDLRKEIDAAIVSGKIKVSMKEDMYEGDLGRITPPNFVLAIAEKTSQQV